MTSKLSRRDMLKFAGTAAAGTLLAACTAPTPAVVKETVVQTVKETVVVTEKETVKETVVVEATPEPTSPPVVKPVEGTVTIMHFRHELTEDQEKAFEADNPGIQVEFVNADQARLFAMLAAGAPPDLYRCQAPSIPQFLARNLLYDLTPYFEVSELLKPDDLMPANNYYRARSPLAIGEGPIYGMVKDFSPDLTIYANTKLFTDAGLSAPDDTKALSFAEITDIARKTTKFEGDRVVNVGYGYEGSWIDRFIMVALAETGLSLYSEAFEKILLTGSEATQAICKWYFDMAKEKLTPSPINPSPNGWFGTDFTADILAMCQYGFWFSAMAESDQNRGHIMMLPAPTWSGTRMDPTVTATGMIMISRTKVPDAAWKVFEWYNGGQPAIDRAKSGWGVPGLKSMLGLIPQETDFQKQANKVLQGELNLETPPVKFNPFIGETTFADAWNKNLDQALKDEITFTEMLANIEEEVNVAIQEGIDRLS